MERAPDPLATAAAPVPQTLSVVVPTFRRPASLARCLRALGAQTRPPDQIIVVVRADDAVSREAVAGLARELPVELVTSDRPLLCAQMDAGVAAAFGDVVALTDDDSAPTAEWAVRLMGLYSEPSVGAAGGRDRIGDAHADGRGPATAVGVVTWSGRPLGNHHRESVGGVRDVDFLKGVNLSVRRSLWYVDRDLLGDGHQSHWELGTCLRIRRLGWRVRYDPGLLVDHYSDARIDEPQRASRDGYRLTRDAHNQLYELLRWLPWCQAVLATVRAVAIGSKELPGIATAIWLVAHGTTTRHARAELRSASHGRWMAISARPRHGRWTPAALGSRTARRPQASSSG
jgi:GT2 family glycosyltransferase